MISVLKFTSEVHNNFIKGTESGRLGSPLQFVRAVTGPDTH